MISTMINNGVRHGQQKGLKSINIAFFSFSIYMLVKLLNEDQKIGQEPKILNYKIAVLCFHQLSKLMFTLGKYGKKGTINVERDSKYIKLIQGTFLFFCGTVSGHTLL